MITYAESRISPQAACKDPRVMRDGQPVSIPTFYRWITRGARAIGGGRVVLETVQTPMGRCTTREAIARFLDALNHRPQPQAASSSQVHDQALNELAAAGIC